ncbi:hypothetical protein WN944_003868 [Citrus x changshan-huyou]|uniref:Uncharacterized protein n=1 Tax=Citrus x changshan-huyou TaxID=2935761 RepID=A0AAP0QLL7_9ROSI
MYECVGEVNGDIEELGIAWEVVDVDEAARFALVLLVERLFLGRSNSRVIDNTPLKLANNLNVFDVYSLGIVVWTETCNSIIRAMFTRAQNLIYKKISNIVYAEDKYSLSQFGFALTVRMFESIILARNLNAIDQND